jgi:hypothetical protein
MWKRWGGLLLSDPGYNPCLTLKREDYSFAIPPRIKPIWEESIEESLVQPTGEQTPDYWNGPAEKAGLTVDRVTDSAAEVIAATHQRVLKRLPEPQDLLAGSVALRKGVTLQAIIADLAKSPQFRADVQKQPASMETAIRLCYDRLLARAPRQDDVSELAQTVEQAGWDAAVEKLVYGLEFNHRFGVYTVPFSDHAPETKLTWHARPANAGRI